MGDKPVELVARFQPDGEAGWVVAPVNTAKEWADFWQILDGWTDIGYATEGEVVGKVTLEVKPEGWAASLPEFEGW